MTATTFHRVRSSHPEDDAAGHVFGPGELVPNLDLDDPFNQRKVEEGIFYPVDEAGVDTAVEEQTTADITPAAAKLATANSIDLASITGTGKNGRIIDEDVQNVIDAQAAQVAANESEGDD
jgi:2-oxoglutarate dehydrogenase E2 component (dihydrolipoamide succinyltransferase)